MAVAAVASSSSGLVKGGNLAENKVFASGIPAILYPESLCNLTRPLEDPSQAFEAMK